MLWLTVICKTGTMKKCCTAARPHLLLFFLIISVSAAAQKAQPGFDAFAYRQDSLMVAAYTERNASKYAALLKELETKYSRLPKEEQKSRQANLANAYYNFACLYSLEKQNQQALIFLEKSIRSGYTNYSHLQSDTDFDNIRTTLRFRELVEPLRETGDFIYILKKGERYGNVPMPGLPPFSYQPAGDPHLQALRKGFNLDSIAGEGNEISRMINLMHWIHELIPHDGEHGIPEVRNAMSLINTCQAEHRALNCRGLATVLNEVYLSMGFASRLLTCLPKDSLGTDSDCHVINMVWSRSMNKWLWFDPTWDAYVMDENGVMLGPGEVRDRLVHQLPLVLSPGANWNHKSNATVAEYLESYMAKNLYMMEAAVSSEYDYESARGGASRSYILLQPLDYRKEPTGRTETKTRSGAPMIVYRISDPEAFWAEPR